MMILKKPNIEKRKVKTKPEKPVLYNKIGIKPRTLGNSCLTDNDCGNGEKCYTENNKCLKFCNSDADCIDISNPDDIWQCNKSSQVCLKIELDDEGKPIFNDEPVIHEWGRILEAWEEKDTKKYWDNIAWWIVNKISMFKPLMPIKCDFMPSVFQDVEYISPTGKKHMKVGHTECKYTNVTRWSGSKEWEGKRASCKDVTSQHYNEECKKKCDDGFEDGYKYDAQSGCDGGVPWCWCIRKER